MGFIRLFVFLGLAFMTKKLSAQNDFETVSNI
jgi:hypothetical protein